MPLHDQPRGPGYSADVSTRQARRALAASCRLKSPAAAATAPEGPRPPTTPTPPPPSNQRPRPSTVRAFKDTHAMMTASSPVYIAHRRRLFMWKTVPKIYAAMVAAGLGFGFMPANAANYPGVVALPVVEPEFWREVNLVSVRGRPHSRAVGALVREAMRKSWFGKPATAVAG